MADVKKAWASARNGSSGKSTSSTKKNTSSKKTSELWKRASEDAHTNRYGDASEVDWVFGDDAYRHHQSYAGQVNAGSAYNTAKAADVDVYSRGAGAKLHESGVVDKLPDAHSQANLAQKQLSEAGTSYMSEEGFQSWMDVATEAADLSSLEQQRIARARTGDTSVLKELDDEIARLKEEGLDNGLLNRLFGTNHYNNQDEIDELEAQREHVLRLFKLQSMEELTDLKPVTSMVGYTKEDYTADLMTLQHKYGLGYDIDDEEYLEAVKRLREFTGSTHAESAAAADPSGRWVDEYMAMYDQRMGTLDEYIDKHSSALGTEYDFNADEYVQYLRSMDAYEAQKAAEDQRQLEMEGRRADLHGELSGNEDYAQNSQYVKGGDYLTMPDGKHVTHVDFGSMLNDLVNAAGTGSFDEVVRELEMIPNGYSDEAVARAKSIRYMTEEDKRDFFYVYNTQGWRAAQEFLDDAAVVWGMNRQLFEEDRKQREENVRKSGWNAALYSLGSIPERLLANFAGGTTFLRKLLGQEVTEYDPALSWGDLANVTRGTTAQMIEEATPGVDILGHNIGKMAYNGMMSAADSVANATLFGHGATPMMAMGSFGDSYQENLAAMGNTSDAFIDATVDGAIEALTEYFSIEGLLDDSASSGIRTLIRQGSTEMSEEVLGDLLRTAYDEAKYGEDSQINQRIKELQVMGYSPAEAERIVRSEFMSGLAETAMTSAISGVAGGAPNAIANTRANRAAGTAIQQNATEADYEGFLNVAGTVELSEAGRRIYEAVQEEWAQQQAERQRNAQISDELDSDSAMDELTDEKGARAQRAAEEARDAQIAEALDDETARDELAGEKTRQAQTEAEEARNEQLADELGSETARSELTDEKTAQAESTAQAAEEARIAEELDAEDARGELAETKNAQAQQAAEEARNASIANELSTEAARSELTDEKAGQAKQRGKKKGVSVAKLGQLYREVMQKLDGMAQDALRQNMSFNIAKELAKQGVRGKEARELAESILRIQDGSFSEADLRAVSLNDVARGVLGAWTATVEKVDAAFGKLKALSGMTESKADADAATEAAEEAPAEEIPEDAPEVEAEPAAAVESDFDATAAVVQEQFDNTLVSDGESSTLDGEAVEILGVESAEGTQDGSAPKLRVRTADGSERVVEADSIAYSTSDEQMYKLAAYSGTYGRNGDLMYAAYESGQDVDEYARAFYAAAQQGSDGRNLTVLRNSGAVDVLTDAQVQTAYEIGRAMRGQRSQGQQATYAAMGAPATTGSVDTSQINPASLNAQQRASVDVMGKLAPVLGVNVRFVESIADAEGRYTSENGSYDPRSRTLTLDIHAGSNYASDTNYAVMHTAGHELTHYIRQFSDSALWDGYSDFILQHLDEKLDLEKEIKGRMSQTEGMSRDAAIEEIVADASGEALSRLSEAQIQEMAQENPSLMRRIARFMKRWIGNLKRQIELAFKGTEAKTEVGRQMQDALDEMAEKWTQLLAQASKKANAGKAQAQSNTQTNVQQTADGGQMALPYAHIDERTLDSVKEMHTELFCSEVEIARVAYAKAAGMLMDDLNQSISGKKIYIWDKGGDLTVTGQGRTTSEMLAHMKDAMGWTWADIRKTLRSFIDMDDASKGYPLVKNTIRNRRMEVYLHEALTEGYTLIDGTRIGPSREYMDYIAMYEGSQSDGAKVDIPEGAIPFEDYISPSEYADDGDVKFSRRESFGEQIDKLRNGTFPMNDHLYVMDTPDVLIRAGLPQLPILMTQKHAWSVMKESGKGDVNYHGLTRTGMKNLPQAIANSSVVIRASGYDNRVIAFTDMKNSNGEIVIAPIQIQGRGNWQNAEIDANILTSAYGKKNIKDMLIKAIMEDDVLYVDKKRSYTLEKTIGVQFPKNLLGAASDGSIAQSDDVVKTSARENSDGMSQLLYQQRDPDQISSRELLATALQGVTQNADEWDNLRRYQKKVAALDEKQRQLEKTNARIRELRAQNSKANRDEILRLTNAANIYARQIDRADGELLKYEAMKPIQRLAERQRELYRQRLKERTDERMRKYRERLRAKTQERIREVRAKSDERMKKAVAKEREAGQRRVDRLKESSQKQKYRARLEKDVSTMREWLTKPTNKGHVPQFLRGPLADFLESLDFTSARALRGGEYTQADARLMEKMEDMRRALARVRSQQQDIERGEADFRGYLDLPEGFADQFDDATARIKQTLAQRGGDTPVNRMTGAQLKELSDMIRTLNTAIRQMNSFLAGNRFRKVSEAAHSTMKALDKLGPRRSQSDALDAVSGFLDWTNATPYYVFKRFGEGGKAVFEGLMDGWDRLAFNSKELIDYANDAYTTQQARAWSRELHEIKLGDGQIQMTTAQIMSLYCLNKREQARGHLLGGGIRVGNIRLKNRTITQADNHNLTEADIQRITGLLTQEQRAVADRLQRFMNTRCTEWGNEVSMQRFGYEAFGDEANYFPIESDSNNLKGLDEKKQDNGSSMFRLLNLSATKSTVKNANNALVVRDIFDVFSAHGTDMAKYNALALPILDALKWYNYVEKTNFEDGSLETASVQKALEKAFGKDAQKYIRNFIKDLNGVREGGRNDGLFNRMLSNYKVAAVAANLRVGLLQITSMPRAAYAISPKYLAVGVAKNIAFGNSKPAETNVGISLWKSLGFYDTNISRNVREMVKHDAGIGSRIKEKSMILAEKGDAWTMGVIYGAVEAEMADKHPDVQKGSDAYREMVNRRMREIVYQTQVVDSTMTRSDIMRDTGAKSSLATAFMSEPTLTMNLLADSIFEQRMKARESGKRMIAPSTKMVRGFAVSAVVMSFSAIMEAAFTAWRDDDEYETFAEKYSETFVDTLLDNLNLLNNIPFVKDVVSAIQGNSAERMDSAWAYNLWQGLTELYKYLNGESTKPPYNGIYKTLNGLSQMSGFAVGGLVRELVSAYNNVIATPMGYTRIQTYADSASDAADAILRAQAIGDDELAERYASIAGKHGIDAEKLGRAMQTAAGETYIAGNIDASAAEEMLASYSGKSDAEIDEQLEMWGYERETGRKYSDMKADYIAGAIDRNMAREYKSEETVSKWDYERDTGKVYDEMREDYLADRISAASAKEYLMTYGGKTEAKAEEQIDRWDCYEVTGEDDRYTKYWRMYYAFENGGDFRKYAREWIDAGVEKRTIAGAISKRYKAEYLAIKGTPAGDAMLEELLDLYEAIGYDRDYERNYINNKWKPD